MRIFFKVAIFSILLSISSFADEYAVVSNKNMKDLSLEQIKAIYLKKIKTIDNLEIVPLNLGTRDPLRKKFEKQIINIEFEELKSYWKNQDNIKKRPPLNMKSTESVKAFVKKVDGAIGYINASEIDETLKILYRWNDNEYAIIANHNMKDLSLKQIRAIFLKKIIVINGIKIQPINAEKSSPQRVNFEKHIIKMGSSRLKSYWYQSHYLGKRAPKEIHSQTNIKTYIKESKGAIGYIDAKNIDDNIKVLYRWKE